MLAAVLALGSALTYGLSDFIGGVLSRSRSPWMVVVCSQLTAATGALVVALAAPGDPTAADFGWAAAAGVGGALGIACLYRGLSRGRMGVVAPLSGTGAALVPVAVGVATGDDPSALVWVGIAIALPALYLVPQTDAADKIAPGETGAGYGIVAGLGFGVLFAMLGQVDDDAGFLPLSLSQFLEGAVVAVGALLLREPWWPRGPRLGRVFAFGLLGTTATTLFLLATREGLLTVVSVIAALYPAGTVVMAAAVLRERIGRRQAAGLACAVAAVMLVTVG